MTSPATIKQVRAQLAAFGCARYEVQPIPPKGVNLPGQRIQRLDEHGIMRILPFLGAKNAEGYDIYIRPAPLADEAATPLAFVDDLDRATVDRMAADGLPIGILIESSPDRFHGWVRLAAEPMNRDELTACARIIAERYSGDPAAADWRHYGRLAGFTNRKPSRRLPTGLPPFATLAAHNSPVAPAAEALCTDAVLAMEWSERARQQALAERKEIYASIPRERLGDAAAAFAEARERGNHRPDRKQDESGKDFAGVLALMVRGYSDEEIAAAILAASPGLADRHRRVEDYIDRTIANARKRVPVAAPVPGRSP